ncbi:MAG: GTP-binding protein, partial [Bacteroidota bacterium]
MELLRIATSGSVDDGKSTLIGRLLFETDHIPTDRLKALEISSQKRGLDFTDLSLLTDGLLAERAQGITIDVAHIYFATKQRKYIIADTPGHVEYTRNMITGASNAEVSIVLIDARRGVLEQTKRHLFIAHLLKLPQVIIAINKMDLVDYDQAVFKSIEKEVLEAAKTMGLESKLSFIPMSALQGEGVTQHLGYQKWYNGSTLLELLEDIPVQAEVDQAARFQVQHVIRPKSEAHPDFRGFAGAVESGVFEVGEEIRNTRTQQVSTVKKLEKWGSELPSSGKDLAVTVHLSDEIDARRGDVFIKNTSDQAATKQVAADICWMNDRPLNPRSTYILQQGTQRTKAKVKDVSQTVNMDNLEWETAGEVHLNDISKVSFKLA